MARRWSPKVRWQPARWSSSSQVVEYKSHLEVDHVAMAKEAGRYSVNAIVERTNNGIGANNRPLGTDLWETGQLLGSVTVRNIRHDGPRTSVEVGPDSSLHVGSSPARGRSLTNIALGSILHHGSKHIRARPWVHLTRRQLKQLAQHLMRKFWLRSKPGPP